MGGEDEVAGVDAGLGLGNGAVVDFDLRGCAGEDDAGGAGGAAGDAKALSLGGGGGADGYGDVGCGVAVVANHHGDQPAGGEAAGGVDLAGSDAFDGEVGQAAIAIDPVREEPAEIFVGGLLEGALEAGGVGVELGIEAVGFEGLLEGVVTDEGAELPPDGGGFGAVEEVAGGGDETGASGADGWDGVGGGGDGF